MMSRDWDDHGFSDIGGQFPVRVAIGPVKSRSGQILNRSGRIFIDKDQRCQSYVGDGDDKSRERFYPMTNGEMGLLALDITRVWLSKPMFRLADWSDDVLSLFVVAAGG